MGAAGQIPGLVVWAVVLAPIACAADFAVLREVKSPPVVPPALLSREVRRIHAVVFNFRLFEPPAARHFQNKSHEIVMNMFPDVRISVRWSISNTQGATVATWTGTVDAAPQGHAVLVCSQNSVSGNITRGDNLLYRIHTGDDGIVWIREIDQSKFPPEAR